MSVTVPAVEEVVAGQSVQSVVAIVADERVREQTAKEILDAEVGVAFRFAAGPHSVAQARHDTSGGVGVARRIGAWSTVEPIGAFPAVEEVVAGEAEDRVIAAVAPDHVVAEGDTIEHIDGFGVVRSFHVSHDSLPFLVRAKFHNRSIAGASICPMEGTRRRLVA